MREVGLAELAIGSNEDTLSEKVYNSIIEGNIVIYGTEELDLFLALQDLAIDKPEQANAILRSLLALTSGDASLVPYEDHIRKLTDELADSFDWDELKEDQV